MIVAGQGRAGQGGGKGKEVGVELGRSGSGVCGEGKGGEGKGGVSGGCKADSFFYLILSTLIVFIRQKE